ncbi:hypothetical protein RFI_34036 [Reticulomyxa filosa]|uniref:Uncharacterized protein n=1 Tax=Reticulomyxa filosa TaxID=46433 RepID=X6LP59_RETFI|nr:hypothetical protein RFI_34036 [Reticulomyxa filosa]|eukprot:ETO03374.1 hypothetical protein RFI_34036 [Reticulomyxa filosa]
MQQENEQKENEEKTKKQRAPKCSVYNFGYKRKITNPEINKIVLFKNVSIQESNKKSKKPLECWSLMLRNQQKKNEQKKVDNEEIKQLKNEITELRQIFFHSTQRIFETGKSSIDITLCSESIAKKENKFMIKKKVQKEQNKSKLLEIQKEVIKALRHISMNKAQGPDNIHNQMINNGVLLFNWKHITQRKRKTKQKKEPHKILQRPEGPHKSD